jgi:protein gp37
MAENSKIEWCDHTFNPWIGCTKVSAGCANCYAEREDKRRHWTLEGWGKGQPRKRTSKAYWRQPFKWEREAKRTGARPRIFCGSLCDVFDWEVSELWRTDLFDLVAATPHLDWLLLTKRIEETAVPESDDAEMLPNLWLGVSVENQKAADKRIPLLVRIQAAVRFVSCEPLLGPINLWRECTVGDDPAIPYIAVDWVICGGESGPRARPMDPVWAQSLRDQCQAAEVPFLFKQWGAWLPSGQDDARGCSQVTDADYLHIGKKAAGHLLDGKEHMEFPALERKA